MNSSVTKIPCTLTSFFKYWLLFTAPLHKLQNKEIEVLAHILRKRYELSKMITDDSLIDSFLFSKEVREQIIEESGNKKSNFQVVLTKLRDKNILLEDNKLNKKFIPNLNKDSNKFDFILIFDINDSK